MVMAIISFGVSCVKMDADMFSANVSLSESFSGFRQVPDGDEAYYALFNYEDKFHENEDEYPRYSSAQLDDMGVGLKAARVFAIVGISLLFIPMIVLLAVPCVVYKQLVVKACGVMLLIGSMCEALTFVIFASDVCSDYDCDFGGGSSFAIVSSVFAFTAGIITLQIKEPVEPQSAPEMPSEAAPGQEGDKKMSDAEDAEDAEDAAYAADAADAEEHA